MENRKYHFESTHVPYAVCDLEVSFNDNIFCFTIDDANTEINITSPSLKRENEEMTMFFDFTTNEAFVELKENGAKLTFDILESDLKFEDNVLHLDFKYILDEEEMFTSISIV